MLFTSCSVPSTVSSVLDGRVVLQRENSSSTKLLTTRFVDQHEYSIQIPKGHLVMAEKVDIYSCPLKGLHTNKHAQTL